MGAKGFRESLLRVKEGQESFSEHARIHAESWDKLAQYVARRWKQPIWHSMEDLRQELLVAGWKAIWDWDVNRGTTIDSYVVYNAVDKAKKRAHKARGASLHGSADNNPSHFDVNFTRLFGNRTQGEWSESDFIDRLLRVEATQHGIVEQNELIRRVFKICRTPRERYLVREAALAGVFEDALALDPLAIVHCAERIYADPKSRLACRLGSERQALNAATDAAAAVRNRFVAALAA
jgi:DNA-directed RNA polymerase specialized sigma24 family protein